jgi:r-opsin
LSTIWGSLFAKANAVYNPIVYGISHPKYRVALLKRYPALGCAGAQAAPADNQSQATTVQSETISEKA